MAYGASTPDTGKKLRNQEEARAARIRAGQADIDKAFSGYTPEFFQERAQAYEAAALPQVTQQFDEASRKIDFGLAGRGLLQSSAAGSVRAGLDRERTNKARDIASIGIDQSNALRQNLENERGRLLAQVQSAADPSGAGEQALRVAQATQQPTSYAPIGNLFSGFLQNHLDNQIMKQYAEAASQNVAGSAQNPAAAWPKSGTIVEGD